MKRKQNSANYIRISAVQMMSASFIVAIAFVIPAIALQYYQTQPNTTIPYTAISLGDRAQSSQSSSTASANNSGQVAGASTTPLTGGSYNVMRIPFTSIYLDLNSETGQLTLAGGILLIVGVAMIFYVITAERPKPKLFPEQLTNFERNAISKWN